MQINLNRFRGCLLGLAAGDAVGTSVEFCPRGSFDPLTDMRGGGPFSLHAGQWTDDTSMAVPIGRALGRGVDLADPATLGHIVDEWAVWALTAPDVGNQTRAVRGRLPDITTKSVIRTRIGAVRDVSSVMSRFVAPR